MVNILNTIQLYTWSWEKAIWTNSLLKSTFCCAVPCLVAQLCLALCEPTDCSPPGSSVHEDPPGRNTGVGCPALLQGIFPTQGSNQVSCTAGGFFTIWATREAQEYWGGEPLPSPGDLPGSELNRGLLHSRRIFFTSWATRETLLSVNQRQKTPKTTKFSTCSPHLQILELFLYSNSSCIS